MEIIKTYFEQTIILLVVTGLVICACILTASFSNDEKEKECFEFYSKHHYLLNHCEAFKSKLEVINE